MPSSCSLNDKYWGRRGPLYCLTDGVGDVAWARLDDTRSHFGMVSGPNASSPDGYSYLCPNGYTIPLNSTNPCIWVVKPWPVVASVRYAQILHYPIQRVLNKRCSARFSGLFLHPSILIMLRWEGSHSRVVNQTRLLHLNAGPGQVYSF